MTRIKNKFTADTYWIAAVSAESAASFTLQDIRIDKD
jgi:hypothetical protein